MHISMYAEIKPEPNFRPCTPLHDARFDTPNDCLLFNPVAGGSDPTGRTC